jgi:hypothetical protein
MGYQASLPAALVVMGGFARRHAAILAGNLPPEAVEPQALSWPDTPEVCRPERRAQCDLLRDIATHPSREVRIRPELLRWNDGTAVKLARSVYEDRLLPSGTLDAGRLAILADALEETGCADADILGHLRSGGEHYRGCWAVDLLLSTRISA